MRAPAELQRTVVLGGAARVSPAEVGAKAARLAEAVRLGLPVPEAFAVTAGAFREFCTANGIRLASEPGGVAERIRAGTLPAALLAELHERLAALAAQTFAVRSSARAEDGTSCSVAGQLQTFLEVPRDDVPARIKACWAALFAPPILAYAARRGMPPSTEMGVVVQRQIHPRYAGVLFTLDPVSGSADHFVIEWGRGMGDALAAGATTPQRIRVSRRRPAPPPDLPPDLATLVVPLAKHAAALERRLGCPVDVEWCTEGEALYLLQARPVTVAMAPGTAVWTSTNIAENFPAPLTPFAWSIVDEFYTRYVRSLANLLGVRDPALERRGGPLHRLTGVQGGRIYYNIRSWYQLLERYVPGGGAALRRGLDQYIGQEVPVPPDPAARGAPSRRPGPLAWLSFWARLTLHLALARRTLAGFEKLFRDYRRALRQPTYGSLGAPALMNRLDALFEDFVARHGHRQCVADLSVVVFPGLLETLLKRWTASTDGSGVLTVKLLRQPGTSGAEAADLIARMAQGIRERPELGALLDSGRCAEVLQTLPAPLSALYAQFMERFGCRCYHEGLIASPTFEERPDLFWDLVCRYRRAPRTPGMASGAAPRPEPADEVLRGLSRERRFVLRLVMGRARRAIALREQGRLVQSLLFGEVRRLALALGEALVRLGRLEASEDVFYLHTWELRDLCAGKLLFPETLPDLVAMRRAALERCSGREPPECFVLPEGGYWHPREPDARGDTAAVAHGVGASSGRAHGTARVILDPTRDRLEPGEILVARSTDPGWTPLFAIAGGLVLERGGILSHGAIVAREFAVPAVVGVEGITRRLRGGELVSVDGDSGEVVILEQDDARRRDRRRA